MARAENTGAAVNNPAVQYQILVAGKSNSISFPLQQASVSVDQRSLQKGGLL